VNCGFAALWAVWVDYPLLAGLFGGFLAVSRPLVNTAAVYTVYEIPLYIAIFILQIW
jgi:hypothetical protein